MTKYIFFTIFSLLIMSCSNNIDNAIKYNEQIVLSYQKVADIEDRLMFYLLTEDSVNFYNEYDKFIIQIDSSEKEIQNLGKFKEDADFSDAALSMLSVYKEVAKEKISDLMAFTLSKSSLNTIDSVEYVITFDNKLHEVDSLIENEFVKFETAQQRFAARYSFKLM